MVLINLVLILSIMVPAFYTFVILGGTTTGIVGTLMIVHAILGAIAEGNIITVDMKDFQFQQVHHRQTRFHHRFCESGQRQTHCRGR